MAPVTPWLAPAITFTATPSAVVNPGISAGAMLRYPGARGAHLYHLSAGVCTAASHSGSSVASSAVTVMEHPAISSDVT